MGIQASPLGRRSGAATEDPARPRTAYPLAEGDPKGALAGVRNGSRATWVDEPRASSPRVSTDRRSPPKAVARVVRGSGRGGRWAGRELANAAPDGGNEREGREGDLSRKGPHRARG